MGGGLLQTKLSIEGVTAAPDISVVIPTRNRWALLSSAALRAALMQEGVSHEVIIVDDSSTEKPQLRIPASNRVPVRIVTHAKQCGVAIARNSGLAAAVGEWVAFLDDDDIWSPCKLRKQLERIRADDADFAYARAIALDTDLVPLYEFPLPDPSTLAIDLLRANVVPACGSNFLTRTSVVRRIGGFDPQLSSIEDWDFALRVAHAGRATAVEDLLIGYIEHLSNMSVITKTAYAEFEYLRCKHRQLAEECGVEADELEFMDWLAYGQRRSGRPLGAAGIYFRSALKARRLDRLGTAMRYAGWSAIRGRNSYLADHLRRLARRSRDRGIKGQSGCPEPEWLALY